LHDAIGHQNQNRSGFLCYSADKKLNRKTGFT